MMIDKLKLHGLLLAMLMSTLCFLSLRVLGWVHLSAAIHTVYACLILLVSIAVEIKFAMYMYSSYDDISIIDYRAMSGVYLGQNF